MFLYPRIISIFRQQGTGMSAGAQPYQDDTYPNLITLITGLPCSIQDYRQSEKPLGGVALDARARSNWTIYVPFGVPRQIDLGWQRTNLNWPGALLSGDIVQDDANARYQVTAATWTPLGWELKSEKLEA